MPNRALPNILTQSRAAVQAQTPAPPCHSPSGRADGKFLEGSIKIFVEKGEVEQM
jgi:hypothetical protein